MFLQVLDYLLRIADESFADLYDRNRWNAAFLKQLLA